MATKVIVNDRFAKIVGEVDRNAKGALEEAARVTVIAARTAETRVRTGRLHDEIQATPVLKSRRGWMVYVYDPVFYARFQEFGTLGRKGAKRSARAKDIAGPRGVKPLHFLAKAVKVGRQVLLDRMQRGLL